MKFKQLSTGAVLETNNKDVIAMMTDSNAYAAVKQSRGKPNSGGQDASKDDKPTDEGKDAPKGDTPTEDGQDDE